MVIARGEHKRGENVMVASCIRHAKTSFLFISCNIACTHLEYVIDKRLSAAIAQDITQTIKALVEQQQLATITQLLPTRYPCIATVTIAQLPEDKATVHITSVEPAVRLTYATGQYVIDVKGNYLPVHYFTDTALEQLPHAHTTQERILQQWNARLTPAITYLANRCPHSHIEIDTVHAIRVNPNADSRCSLLSDAYQLPTADQLAICKRQQEEHANQPAMHLKKCKQVMFDTRFDKQIIQRCTVGGTNAYTT